MFRTFDPYSLSFLRVSHIVNPAYVFLSKKLDFLILNSLPALLFLNLNFALISIESLAYFLFFLNTICKSMRKCNFYLSTINNIIKLFLSFFNLCLRREKSILPLSLSTALPSQEIVLIE